MADNKKRILVTSGIVAVSALAIAGSQFTGNTFNQKFTAQDSEVNSVVSHRVCPGPVKFPESAGGDVDAQFAPKYSEVRGAVTALANKDHAIADNLNLKDVGGGMLQKQVANQKSVGVAGLTDLFWENTKSLNDYNGLAASAATSGDLKGLAAGYCVIPSNDTWLIGGSTNTGRSTVLAIANISDKPSTVNLEFFTENPNVNGTSAQSYVIGSHSQKLVNIAALTGNQGNIAIHATSTGGATSIFAQTTVLRGTTPGGISYVMPSQALSKRQVITGVSLDDISKVNDEDMKVYGDSKGIVRVTNPGDKVANVTVTVYAEGSPLSVAMKFQVQPKTSLDKDLDGIAGGKYSFVVTSDVPVASGVRNFAISDDDPKTTDLAWMSTGDAVKGANYIIPAPELDNQFTFFATSAAQATIAPINNLGEVGVKTSLSFAANTQRTFDSSSLPLTENGYLLEVNSGDLYVGQNMSRGDGAYLASAQIGSAAQNDQQEKVRIIP
ncbi:MAG: DUF5719 family protein [Micrococcaceae bacterium]